MARKAGAHAVGVTTGLYDNHAFLRVPSEERAHCVLETLETFCAQPWCNTPQGAL